MFEAFKCPKLGFTELYREYKSFLDSPFAQNGGDSSEEEVGKCGIVFSQAVGAALFVLH